MIIILCKGCDNTLHKRIVQTYNDGSKLEKWVINDSIDDGATIKYYPSGYVQSMFIAKNDSLKGKFILYYDGGSVKSLAEMNQTIVDGFAYDFYPNRKFKEVSYYNNGELIYKKVFNKTGNIIKQLGYIPVDFSKISNECEFKPLTWKEIIQRNKEQKVFIKWYGCPEDALDIFINEGEIKQTKQKGIYSLKTNVRDTVVIISIRVYDPKRQQYITNDFGFDVR